MNKILTNIKRLPQRKLIVGLIGLFGLVIIISLFVFNRTQLKLTVGQTQIVQIASYGSDEGEKYVAAKVTVTNNTDNAVELKRTAFNLVTRSGEEIAAQSADDTMPVLYGETLPAHKTRTGYVLFRANKNFHYDMQIKATDEAGRGANSGKVTFTMPTKALNQSGKTALTVFVNTVLLGQKNLDDYSRYFATSDKKTTSTLKNDFSKKLAKVVFFGAELTGDGADKVYSGLQTANSLRGNFSIKTVTQTPSTATLVVTAKTVDISSMGDDVYDAVADKVTSDMSDDQVDDLLNDTLTHVATDFKNIVANYPVDDEEDYKISMTKRSGHWVIDTDADDYKKLVDAFYGHLNEAK
jgi:hypothetical protein